MKKKKPTRPRVEDLIPDEALFRKVCHTFLNNAQSRLADGT
jgi:hypothetical protein